MSKPSLRARLLLHVLLPLLLTWGLGMAVVFVLAQHFVGKAYDRALLDDAYFLASNITLEADALQLKLSSSDLRNLLFDQSEHIYFAVYALYDENTTALIAGHARLTFPREFDAQNQVVFDNPMVDGQPARRVALYRDAPRPHVLMVAQTARARDNLLNQSIKWSLLP
ncbi:MAG: hypothetical protein RLZZ502_753, partial [Pseudomonadota bacterium]